MNEKRKEKVRAVRENRYVIFLRKWLRKNYGEFCSYGDAFDTHYRVKISPVGAEMLQKSLFFISLERQGRVKLDVVKGKPPVDKYSPNVKYETHLCVRIYPLESDGDGWKGR